MLPRATEEAVHRDYFVLELTPLDLAHGLDHGSQPPSPTSAWPPARPPRGGSPRSTRPPRTPRCSRSPTRSRPAPTEILEANARDLEAGREIRPVAPR